MPGTFHQIYLQIVYAVKGRQNLLLPEWRQEVFKYTAGIIKAQGSKPIIVNGVGDHVHVFLGMKPAQSVSDLVREMKTGTNQFINERGLVGGRFSWQEGYGVFSYGHSQIQQVYDYILNQEAHHAKRSFREEYHEFLEKFEVPYEERFLFEWIE